MNIKLYQEFIEDLMEQGVKVQELTLLQISHSVRLYKNLRIRGCRL
ncbi:hypothetical protein [Clostridium chromiireducens]|nr:hypothetical protein [Clostridium chromiireducens]